MARSQKQQAPKSTQATKRKRRTKREMIADSFAAFGLFPVIE